MERNSQTPYKKSVPDHDIIDIRAIIIKYLRKWYWFAISVFICVAIAFVYLRTTAPTFNVQTSILLRDAQSTNPFSAALLGGLGSFNISMGVEDEIQILTTRTLTSQVIRGLNIETEYFVRHGRLRPFVEIYPLSQSPIRLVTPPDFNETLSSRLTFDIRRTKRGYNIELESRDHSLEFFVENLSSAISTPYGEIRFNEINPIPSGARFRIVTFPIQALTTRYLNQIRVAPVNRHSNVINISTVSAMPAKAIDILNKLVKLYMQDGVDERNLTGQSTADFATEQIQSLENDLHNIEMQLEKYRRSHNLTDISSEARILLSSMSEYNSRLAEIETQIQLAEHLRYYLTNEVNQYNLIPANLATDDVALRMLIQEYNNALMDRMRLLRSANEQNPAIVQIDNALAVWRTNLIASINSTIDGLNIARNDLRRRETQFATQIQQIPTQEREYIELRRRQEVAQALYVLLLQRQKENEMQLAITTSTVRLLDSAFSSGPVAPRRMIILFIALMFGFALPVIVLYIMDLMNNKIQSKAEFQRLVHAPFIGSIGYNDTEEQIVVTHVNTSHIVEMFRQLRTNVQFMIAGKKNPVILITSSISGEGKSFISTNLALSFTSMKKKVVIVGLDIRNPMLGKYFNIPIDNKGVTVFLSNPDLKLEDITTPLPNNPNISVIQAGPIPPNPTELLMSERLDELFADLREKFDYIIIDSAPMGVVSDTYQINRVADTTIFVVRQDYTPREWTAFINETYENNRLNNMSVLLNGVEKTDTYYSVKYIQSPENGFKSKIKKLLNFGN